MTSTTGKTYKFDSSLWFTHLKHTYLGRDKDGKQYYARLAKGEDTIVKNKQSEHAVPYRMVVDGEFKAVTDKIEQDWLENHPDFGTRIQEHDPAAEHKAKMQVISGTAKTMQAIVELGETEARGIGYRKFGRKALSQDINELKGMLIASANEDHEEMDRLMAEKTETDFALIGVAMAKDIIYEAKGGNEVRFKDTDEVVTTVRANERPIDAVASFLQSGAGKEIKKVIYQKLTPVVVDEITENETKPKGRPSTK